MGMVLLSITSCNKKDKNNGNDLIPSAWSPGTVDDNKAIIENNGIQAVQQMQDLNKDQTAVVIKNLVSVTDSSNGLLANKAVSGSLTPFEMLSNSKTSINSKYFNQELKAAYIDNGEFTTAWSKIVAKYTYNFQTKQFDSTGSSDAIIIEFPGKPGDVTNTATITINNFTTHNGGIHVVNGDSLDLTDLPATLQAKLDYNGTTISSFNYQATGPDGKLFTQISTTFTVGTFTMSMTANQTPSTDASYTYSFKNGDNILFESHAAVSGNWDQSNIDANTSDTNFYFENILQNANAYIQIMNIKVAGIVDIKSLGTEVRKIENDTSEASIKKEADLINKYAQLAVIDASKNTKLAGAEAYAYTDDYGQWTVGMRFVFADGSKVDPDTYFKSGFQDLIDQMNQLITDINTDYGTSLDTIQQ